MVLVDSERARRRRGFVIFDKDDDVEYSIAPILILDIPSGLLVCVKTVCGNNDERIALAIGDHDERQFLRAGLVA